MSGGVDSSVAACLLREQGYDIVGVFMRLGAEHQFAPADGGACRINSADSEKPTDRRTISLPVTANSPPAGSKSKGCCSAADATDARVVAGKLGIPFYALNFEADFGRLVDYFVEEYANARTPNPCVRCNQWLKFGKLMDYAAVVEADMIATGHYARIDHEPDRSRLRRAAFREKDQSYVLFGIERDVIRKTLFPLGDMTKSEVRDQARRFGLALHDKPESQDICFVPDGDYARLVRARKADAFVPGEIRHVDGRILGEHEGLANFTVGQRRGLRVAVGTPIYVTDLDAETATVIVGPKESVLSTTVCVSNINWLRETPGSDIRADVQIRYHHDAAPATVRITGPGSAYVEFDEGQPAVTPGQAAVFYDGDEVVGGGWIDGK